MKIICLTLLFLLIPLIAFAAKANFYLDSAEIILESAQKPFFIGFNSNVRLSCLGKKNSVSPTFKIKEGMPEGTDCYLCPDYKKLNELKNSEMDLKSEIQSAKNFLNKLKLKGSFKNSTDFKESVKFLEKKIHSATQKLHSKENELKTVIKEKRKTVNYIKNSAPEIKPYYFNSSECQDVKMATQRVNFNLNNKIIIPNTETGSKNAEIIREIAFRNTTGIDIEIDSGKALFARKNTNFRVPEFNPWVIRKIDTDKKKTASFAARAPEKASDISGSSISKTRGNVFYLNDISILSDGIKHYYTVSSTEESVTVENVVYTFRSNTVFKKISLKYPFDFIPSSWSIFAGNEQYKNTDFNINKNRINLFGGKNNSIKVEKSEKIDFSDKKGIFNGKKRIKDGYEITVSNQRDKKQTVKVFERIPVSSDENIRVENVNVSDGSHKILENGLLLLNLKLAAGEVRKISVSFDIVYDDDIKIKY